MECKKGDDEDPDVRTRAVVCETNCVSNIAPDDINSVFSATPPLEAIRAQCSLMMSLKPVDGEPIVMQFLDISKAYPHCSVLRDNVYVRLPKEFGISAGMCALLVMCLYGLWDAPKAFEFRLREAFVAAGYTPGEYSACCYCLKKLGVTYVAYSVIGGWPLTAPGASSIFGHNTYYSLLIIHCSLVTTRYSLLATHYSLLTADYSPHQSPTTHCLGNRQVSAAASNLEQVAAELARSKAQVMIRWVLQQGLPLVLAAHSQKHLATDMKVFDFQLTQDQMERLSDGPIAAVMETTLASLPMQRGILEVAMDNLARGAASLTRPLAFIGLLLLVLVSVHARCGRHQSLLL